MAIPIFSSDKSNPPLPRVWKEDSERVELARLAKAVPPTFGDCIGCDNYILAASEAPYCPTCARLKREGKAL